MNDKISFAMLEQERNRKLEKVDQENWKTIKEASIWFIVVGAMVFALSSVVNFMCKLGL